ncbi:MAG: CDP-alcohol phosphatidyltransferase family protein [Actinomycetota bacterium]|jgi:phosphatidylglycerophosphate synthase|nr:CDP-alcohol phosphatidyltransferase family protein [Actinomycetota bacterium]
MTDIVRPSRPTVAEIREVCQPPAVRGRRNSEHWVADVYLRDISPYLTRLLLRTPISANGVTWLMIATGVGAAAALLIPGLPGGVLAALLGQMQMLWDCSDGEVARWRQTSSPKGVFLDRVGHYTTEGLIPIALGLRAAGFPGEGWLDTPWPLIGALLSVLILYNKALNDMVHVSRAYNNLPRLEEKADVAAPRSSGLRRVRSLVRFFPFNRAYHSVELTLLALVASVIDAALGDLSATRVLVAFLALFGVVTVVGHLMAILSSSRLR